jgi:hypothetical protein
MEGYPTFATQRRALAYVIASTHGRHDRATIGLSPLLIAVWPEERGQYRHGPRDDRWDASWLLFPTRRMLSVGELVITQDVDFQIDEKGPRWMLTARGWTESMGISSEVAEVFTHPERREKTRLCTLCRRPRDNDHVDLCPICLAADNAVE